MVNIDIWQLGSCLNIWKKATWQTSIFVVCELLLGVAVTIAAASSFFLPSWLTYRPDRQVLEVDLTCSDFLYQS
jgi:hypothetical protein